MRRNHYFYNESGCFDPTAGIACVRVDRQIRKSNTTEKTNKPMFHKAWVNPNTVA